MFGGRGPVRFTPVADSLRGCARLLVSVAASTLSTTR